MSISEAHCTERDGQNSAVNSIAGGLKDMETEVRIPTREHGNEGTIKKRKQIAVYILSEELITRKKP